MNQLAPAVTALRLSLHVLAATIWVGGQLTIAGLVPDLRALGGDATVRVSDGLIAGSTLIRTHRQNWY